jgi:hypothetical protein
MLRVWESINRLDQVPDGPSRPHLVRVWSVTSKAPSPR